MTKRGPYIFKRSGLWVMRFRETLNDGGTLRTVQRARPLCADSLAKSEARKLALGEMKKLDQSRPAKPELVVSLGDFVTRVYLPFVEANKRAATAHGYSDIWESHFAPREHVSRKLLKDARTADVYSWLSEIAATDRNKHGEPLRKNTLKHVKSFVSGVFTHAKCHGYYDGANPANGATIPAAPAGDETYAYSLEEIASMLAVLPEPARTMVATAAFTGLRRSELRGLLWEGYSNDVLRVIRSIVEGNVEDCKTRASRAAVPLLPSLERVLHAHRQRELEPATGPIFRTSLGTALDPNNVLNRQILPALNRCATCKRPEDQHTAKVMHKYERDASLPAWHGWHAFRRGLATNLYRLGTQEKVIQGILRHANVATTATYYIKPVSEDSTRAMAALDAVLCSTCALESTEAVAGKLQ